MCLKLKFLSEVCNTSSASDGILASKPEFHFCRSDETTQGKPFNKGGERGGSGAGGGRYVKPRITCLVSMFAHLSFTYFLKNCSNHVYHPFTVALAWA
jgi:hypothetical protein